MENVILYSPDCVEIKIHEHIKTLVELTSASPCFKRPSTFQLCTTQMQNPFTTIFPLDIQIDGSRVLKLKVGR